ncbi:MAG: hypothetical protein LBK53_01235 [Heliobacteriaceae bacterium]|jgi:hypothetical protein|nr:hypothetical protein [Heliobacteriaceae bacterium]
MAIEPIRQILPAESQQNESTVITEDSSSESIFETASNEKVTSVGTSWAQTSDEVPVAQNVYHYTDQEIDKINENIRDLEHVEKSVRKQAEKNLKFIYTHAINTEKPYLTEKQINREVKLLIDNAKRQAEQEATLTYRQGDKAQLKADKGMHKASNSQYRQHFERLSKKQDAVISSEQNKDKFLDENGKIDMKKSTETLLDIAHSDYRLTYNKNANFDERARAAQELKTSESTAAGIYREFGFKATRPGLKKAVYVAVNTLTGGAIGAGGGAVASTRPTIIKPEYVDKVVDIPISVNVNGVITNEVAQRTVQVVTKGVYIPGRNLLLPGVITGAAVGLGYGLLTMNKNCQDDLAPDYAARANELRFKKAVNPCEEILPNDCEGLSLEIENNNLLLENYKKHNVPSDNPQLQAVIKRRDASIQKFGQLDCPIVFKDCDDAEGRQKEALTKMKELPKNSSEYLLYARRLQQADSYLIDNNCYTQPIDDMLLPVICDCDQAISLRAEALRRQKVAMDNGDWEEHTKMQKLIEHADKYIKDYNCTQPPIRPDDDCKLTPKENFSLRFDESEICKYKPKRGEFWYGIVQAKYGTGSHKDTMDIVNQLKLSHGITNFKLNTQPPEMNLRKTMELRDGRQLNVNCDAQVTLKATKYAPSVPYKGTYTNPVTQEKVPVYFWQDCHGNNSQMYYDRAERDREMQKAQQK